MDKQLFVLFTMDVEPSTANPGVSGPDSDEAGMRAILDFQAVLRSAGFRATYFVHPELALAYADFYLELADEGNGIGLHLHTTKFSPAKQPYELGGLVPEEQKRVLRIAADMFAEGLGERPKIFRPGCFSANDGTYKVLTELGFSGGSISIPGRIWTDRFCVWSGAYPYIHFAHENFRQCEGALPFVEIPLSVALNNPLRRHPLGFYHYPDLRPGGIYSETDEVPYDRCKLMQDILMTTAADNPPAKTLVIDVHNDRDFAGMDSQASQNLRTLLDNIGPECGKLGWEVVPAVFEGVIRHYKELRG